jgi:hypothetical protein
MSKDLFIQIYGVISILFPAVCYFWGHYRGYKWARKNPDKLHIEIFFEIDKETKP